MHLHPHRALLIALLAIAALPLASCGDDPAPATGQVEGNNAANNANNASNNASNNAPNNADPNSSTNNAPNNQGNNANNAPNNAAPAQPAPIFIPVTELTSPERFYDHPYPSDARLTAVGAPDLSRFPYPAGVPLVPELIEAIGRDIRGFSPQAGIYFRFEGPVDPTSLPATLEASVGASSTVLLIDIDEGSPGYGERLPVEVHFRETAGRFWVPNTLVALPAVGRPLRPGTTYAAIVTAQLRGSDGRDAPRNAAVTELLDPALDAGATLDGRQAEQRAFAPLRAWIAAEGFDAEQVLTATVFTTADPAAQMERLRAFIHRVAPTPTATDWQLVEVDNALGVAIYELRYEALDFLAGEPPFRTPGTGIILFDEAGEPTSGEPFVFRAALTTPIDPPADPTTGYPIVQYSHGAGGDYRSFIDDEGAWAASVGLAMISIDNPMHGERDPTNSDFVQYLVDLALTNLVAGRDLYRHGVPDHIQLARLLKAGVTVPAEVSHSGEPLVLDATHLQFASHSMGSQIGTLLVAVEPDISAAFFSEGGGSLSTAFVQRKANNVDILQLVALAFGVDLQDEPLLPWHPLIGLILQTILDPADPLNSAPLAIREPRQGKPPTPILMTEGMEDPQTLPPTIEALAATYGLPVIEPVAAFPLAHTLWGLSTTSTPATDNVTLGPVPVTGGLLQFPDQGHFPLYRVPAASVWFRGWISSAAAGSPTIVAP